MTNLGFISLACFFLIAIAAGALGHPGLGFQANILANLLEQLTGLLILSLVIERAFDVIFEIVEKSKIQELEDRFIGAKVAASVFATNGYGNPEVQNEILGTVSAARENLSRKDEEKSKLRLSVALISATVISALGPRLLTTILDQPGAGIPQNLFFTIDVLFTAAILAGGSEGIARLMNVLRDLNLNAKARAILSDFARRGSATAWSKQEINGMHERLNALSAQSSHRPEYAAITRDHASHIFHSHVSGIASKNLDDLDLAEHAKSAAISLKSTHPSVVFTSGRRGVSDQARAMANNIVQSGNRKWIEQTYRFSAERTALQNWVDNNPNATTTDDISDGLKSIMSSWTDAQRLSISRHLAGLAFDVQPVSGPTGEQIKQTIENLPNLRRFLTNEAGLVRWHAEFDKAQEL